MTTKTTLLKRLSYGVIALAIAVLPTLGATQASAAQITSRSVVLGSSLQSASTTYAFTFTLPTTGTIVQSVSLVPVTTASGSTPVTGFSGLTATSGQPSAGLGDTSGWATTDSTTNELRLSKSGNTATPSGATTVTFSNVTNPSATNSTFFIRITTYANANWTSAIDSGVVAASTAGQIVVNATVDETLTFTLAGSTVSMSTPTTSATGTGVSTMVAATNAASGYSISVSGNTLTGPSTLTAMPGGGGSSVNNKQFGINLVANTTPGVGTAVTGTGSGVAHVANGYGSADVFKFVSGNIIAHATAPTNSNTFTVSYIANIDGSTLPGAYTTTLTYVATPNF